MAATDHWPTRHPPYEGASILPFRGARPTDLAQGSTDVVPHAQPPQAAFASFEELFVAEATSIIALLHALTGQRAAAEDIAQEAFARAYRNWGRIASYERPGAWVRRVAINLAISEGRRRTREMKATTRLAAMRQRTVAGADEELQLTDATTHLWTLVRKLPPQQRAAVTLHYVNDCSVRDIALILGCAEGTAKANLHRGRATLGSQLADRRPDDAPIETSP
jgi:RNA polymerase sigma-70 factor (ECF subfamily)